MKIADIVIKGSLKTDRIAKDLWRLRDDASIIITTQGDVYQYDLKKGFRTDYRSGSKFGWVNWCIGLLLPKRGNGGFYDATIMVHDANHNLAGVGLDFKDTNELFRAMLVFSGVKKWIARIGFRAVGLAKKDFSLDNGTDWYNRYHDLICYVTQIRLKL